MATKVQLAWKTLHSRRMPSGNDYYTQIYRRKPLQTEINNTIGEPLSCNVVVNHHIDLTEEEKAEQRDIALKRYQEEELRKIQVRNSRPKPSKPKVSQQAELSLFDF
ncbi:Cas9 inhibitor AcrIIA9 family protein [Phocaeicola vulgatus]|uniref:Cas9 inhibitor AcrIIA9 family protein n=1 Tax=Phocaeicola vulgatus TaxID=821 RepID=UPI003D707A99